MRAIAERHHEQERQPRLDVQRVDEVRPQQHELAVGEVDHRGRLVDDHEAKCDKGVGRTEGETLDEELEEVRHRAGA